MQDRKRTEKSQRLFEEGRHKLVGGVASALHKAEWEEYPIFIERAQGSRIYDVDGNEYIDYMGGYGPMILGYCPPAVDQAVIEQIGRGTQYAAPFAQLNRLSSELTRIIPCAELVSYACTGTEANMLNFRLARAFTGKAKILKFEGHYHGWSDEEWISHNPLSVKMLGPRNNPWKVLSSAGQRLGALDDVLVLPWNDLDLVRQVVKRHGHEIAAVITEPVMFNAEPVLPDPGYLEGLRAITQANDIVLIFDEVITGFRLALGGAQQFYGVTPDLCTFAKAVAGGYPLAGVAGKREILESGVQPAGTFNANPIVVAAALATLAELGKPGVYEGMERVTRRLAEGTGEIAARKGIALYSASIASVWQVEFGITGPMRDYRDTLRVDKSRYQQFRTLCLERGIRLHPSRGRFYVSAAHTDADVDRTLEVVEEVLTEMARA
jgi:glutamate-1-semialdehyde 2,1-aminomutase